MIPFSDTKLQDVPIGNWFCVAPGEWLQLKSREQTRDGLKMKVEDFDGNPLRLALDPEIKVVHQNDKPDHSGNPLHII